MVIRELITKFGFDVDEKKLDRTERAVSRVKAVLGTIATGYAVSQVYNLVTSVAQLAAQTGDTARQLRVSADFLQDLGFVAKSSGTDLGSMTMALKDLSKRAAGARSGSKEDAKAFAALGISVADLNGPLADTEALFKTVTARVQSAKDPIKAATDTMGKGGAEVLKLPASFDQAIARAKELGGALQEVDRKALADFDNSLGETRFALQGVKNSIALGLLPFANRLNTSIKNWIIANKGLIRVKLAEWGDRLAVVWERTTDIIRRTYGNVKRVTEAFGGWEKILKAVGIAIALYIGANTLMAIGSLAQSLAAATNAFKLFGNGALIANIKALALPLLIGAIIVGIALLVDDLNAMWNGHDSLIGRAIEKWGAWGEAIRTVTNFLRAMKDVVTDVLPKATSDFVDMVSGEGEYSDSAKRARKDDIVRQVRRGQGPKWGPNWMSAHEARRYRLPEDIAAPPARLGGGVNVTTSLGGITINTTGGDPGSIASEVERAVEQRLQEHDRVLNDVLFPFGGR